MVVLLSILLLKSKYFVKKRKFLFFCLTINEFSILYSMNRINKFPNIDRQSYEIQSSDIAFQVAFGDDADKHIEKFKKETIVKVDICNDNVRICVDSELIVSMKCLSSSTIIYRYPLEEIIMRRYFDPLCIDAAVKWEIYMVMLDYGIKSFDNCSILFNDVDVEQFIFYSSYMIPRLYDKTQISLTKNGGEMINLMKLVSTACADYLQNDCQLSDDMAEKIKEGGLSDRFLEFVKQYS